jgi:FAD/FMN-containing dehydrogenase/Fe-S oxidoreductase
MQNIVDFTNDLKKNFSGEIKVDPVTRHLYSTDASIYQFMPHAVLIPRTQEDLIAAVEFAAKYRLPILPRGSGSSLAGQAIGEAIIVDHSKYLNHMVGSIDVERKEVVVEPGLILAHLNKQAAKFGLMFGPDPASSERATLGGVIGNNATGAHSIRYGMTADHLVSCQVLQSDGTSASWGEVAVRQSDKTLFGKIVNHAFDIKEGAGELFQNNGPRTWRNSAGYRLNYLIPWSATRPEEWGEPYYPRRGAESSINLAPIMAGSEGTLGVIQQARLKLVDKPKFTVLAILAYKSIIAACEDVPYLLGHHPSAIELIPQNLIQLAKSVPAYSKNLKYFNGESEAFLVLEFSGDDKSTLFKKCQVGRDVIYIAESSEDQNNIWVTRKVGLGLFDSTSNSERPIAFIEDCAIPVENLGKFVSEIHRIFEMYQVQASYYAHASAGCLHVRPTIDLRSKNGKTILRNISTDVAKLTFALGGSMSSEHGDGIARGEWVKDTYGSEIFQLMQDFKQVVDPYGILNPKKIVNAPLLDSNLRNDQKSAINLWEPAIHFESTGGFLRTVEKCNGQGVCRKEDGVMCPSFQVTKDEVFSTRGRANLLREFIYSENTEISIKDLKETFDLCLACKGCKSECPSKVDVAKLKVAFLDRYYQDHSHSLRDTLFGYLPVFTELFAPFPALFNLAALTIEKFSPLRKALAISDKHAFPKMNKPVSFLKEKRIARTKCILVTDTYSHFFDTQIEASALSLLHRLGVEVISTKTIGAGRTFFSKGFLKQAKSQVRSLIDEINALDPEGTMPIIGLEPSEVYILKDEIFDVLDAPFADLKKIADRVFFIDEYLLREVLGTLDFTPSLSNETTVLLHGHCHQKAQTLSIDGVPVGVEATRLLLEKFGYKVNVLNTGCCGMAGSFGYEVEHAATSLGVANLTLFPAIKQSFIERKTIICSPGTSCRTQITDGVNKPALHTVEILDQTRF